MVAALLVHVMLERIREWSSRRPGPVRGTACLVILDGSPEVHLILAVIVLLPLSSPMVRPTVTGFSVPVKSAPLPSTVNS